MALETVNGFTLKGEPVLKESAYEKRKRTDYLVVHCADTRAHLDIDVGTIREWHQAKGWKDVGYHYVIRRNGLIEIGRPYWAVGSGVEGHNSNSVHICLVGGRGPDGKGENNFTEEQFRSLKYVIAQLQDREYKKAEVCGHRDFPGVKKECPSFDAKQWWAVNKESAKKLLKEQPV